MKRLIASIAVIGAVSLGATSANATIATFFDDYTIGPVTFDSTVAGAGGTVVTDNWAALPTGTSIVRTDYTITKNNGAIMSPGPYSYGAVSTSGETININPSSADVNASRAGSALRFTFNTAVNAIGFEVGDWATCCAPSSLFISFDGGAPILVGTSLTPGDQFLTGGTPNVFVGAIDDTASFSVVEFWGNGLGEFLVAGGTIRYANVDEGSLPPSVPEPGMIAMFGLGLLGLGLARRRRRA
ncbi:MAG: PEP-CTERM sorting domain-containing protein [Rhodospirillaceae bacterium]